MIELIEHDFSSYNMGISALEVAGMLTSPGDMGIGWEVVRCCDSMGMKPWLSVGYQLGWSQNRGYRLKLPFKNEDMIIATRFWCFFYCQTKPFFTRLLVSPHVC